MFYTKYSTACKLLDVVSLDWFSDPLVVDDSRGSIDREGERYLPYAYSNMSAQVMEADMTQSGGEVFTLSKMTQKNQF